MHTRPELQLIEQLVQERQLILTQINNLATHLIVKRDKTGLNMISDLYKSILTPTKPSH